MAVRVFAHPLRLDDGVLVFNAGSESAPDLLVMLVGEWP